MKKIFDIFGRNSWKGNDDVWQQMPNIGDDNPQGTNTTFRNNLTAAFAHPRLPLESRIKAINDKYAMLKDTIPENPNRDRASKKTKEKAAI